MRKKIRQKSFFNSFTLRGLPFDNETLFIGGEREKGKPTAAATPTTSIEVSLTPPPPRFTKHIQNTRHTQTNKNLKQASKFKANKERNAPSQESSP